MGKFDPIDIFFIAIISTYFIALICVGITFLCITISKREKNKQLVLKGNASVVEVKEEDVVHKKNKKDNSKKLKERLVAIPLFRKLFIKEVKVAKEEEEPVKVLETKKVKIKNE